MSARHRHRPSRAAVAAPASRTPITPAGPTAAFADLMAELPAAVAVITTAAPDATPLGMLVTSMGAYTAEPPSVMVSIAHASRCHEHLLRAEHFGVHILHTEQEPLARIFASRGANKFTDLAWTWDGEVPCLDRVLAYLCCRRAASFVHLDHTIVIGAIRHVERAVTPDPMLYLRRRFDWSIRDVPSDHDPANEWPAWFDSDFGVTVADEAITDREGA